MHVALRISCPSTLSDDVGWWASKVNKYKKKCSLYDGIRDNIKNIQSYRL